MRQVSTMHSSFMPSFYSAKFLHGKSLRYKIPTRKVSMVKFLHAYLLRRQVGIPLISSTNRQYY